MSQEVITSQGVSASIVEQVLLGGDLSHLSVSERLQYYKAVCESLGLNALTKPFDYLELDAGEGKKKLTLYATKNCTDQLRSLRDVSVVITARELVDGIYTVTSKASLPNGRTDESIGAVPFIKEGGDWKTASGGKRYFQPNGTYYPLPPNERANSTMKAETKSKRRVTLSICGLSIPDESEIETIAGARQYVEPIESSSTQPVPPQNPTPPPPPPKPAAKPTVQAKPESELPEAVQKMYAQMTNKKGVTEVFTQLIHDLCETIGEIEGAAIYNQTIRKYGKESYTQITSMVEAKKCALDLYKALNDAVGESLNTMAEQTEEVTA